MQAPLQARNDSDAAQRDNARTVAQKWVLADNRPEAMAQPKLAEMMNNSPRVLQQRALSDAIHNSPRMVAQRHEMNALFDGAVKPQGDGAMPAEASLAQRAEKTNNTGLPNQLKSGIESLSGMSMDHVKVHYNSSKPAQLQAHAYAQGNEIHLGADQERHLPHEAWHVVQQAQGRVRPTLQMKAGAVNDDPSLEKEADIMGGKAAQFEGGYIARNRVAEKRVAGVATQRVGGFGSTSGSNTLQCMSLAAGRTKIEDLFEKKNNYGYDSDEEEEKTPALTPAQEEAKTEFASIKERVGGMKWKLAKTDREHCYVEVIRHFYKPDQGLEDVYPEKFGEEVEADRTLYYSMESPLLDLEHEMDHIEQQEAYYAEHNKYLYTTWDYWDWGAKDAEPVFDQASKNNLANFDNLEEGPRNRALKFEREGEHVANGEEYMTEGQNAVAEFQNYMREYIRLKDMNETREELDKIATQVEKYREDALKLVGTADPFVKACERIIPFNTLMEKYNHATEQ